MNLPELKRWVVDDILRYQYTSYDRNYLEAKISKAIKVIERFSDGMIRGYIVAHTIRETGYLVLGETKKIHFTLDVIITREDEQDKCKKNINHKEGDL